MIRDADASVESPVETLIVGAGPAGLTLAMELARLGRPSLVLESGPRAGGGAEDLSVAHRVDPDRHDDMRDAVARRLGGTSNLWGGRCIPLDPVDFEPRPFAQGARWPIGYDEIAPFYAAACRYATCGEAVFEEPVPGHADDADMSLSKLERSSNRPRFQVAHRDTLEASPLIDIRIGSTMVDCELAETGRATHVVMAGATGERRRIAARRVVLAAGGLETTRLLLAMRRRRADLFGGRDGALGRFYMGHIIGEIADVTFADDAMDAAFDFFRDGHGSFVRRRLTPSAALQAREGLPNICFWPVVPPIADARHRSGALSAVALALSTPGLGRRLVPEAIRARHLGGAIDWGAHARNVALDLPRTAAFLASFLQRRYLSAQRISGYFVRNRARRYGLSYSSEQSPRADSRVTLTSETDRLGLSRLSIDLRFHEEDAEAVARAHACLAAWLGRRGLGTIEYRGPKETAATAVLAQAAHGTHQIGLARMGLDRRAAVVDRDLRCFDVPNLYVLGSAVFPTSGQANPTLSIVAFAARLAATLAVARD